LSNFTLSALPQQLFIEPLYLLNSLNICQGVTKHSKHFKNAQNHTSFGNIFLHIGKLEQVLRLSLMVTLKQWLLAPTSRDSRDSQITCANLARPVTFFSKMACDECQRVWRVLAKRLGVCRGVWWVLPKVDMFGRVLALTKYAQE